ncbi:MAG: hypothetical protein FMNOHCHN_02068 [Ignavibacteriaceae bacterium]|nr:hypothetical protein [Ignavibacteriaceae bacterium]
MTTNIDELIALAKAKATADLRHKNSGRPRIGIPPNEVVIISKMRQRGIALRNIHEVMKEKNLTRYKNYGTFNAAWKSHLAEKN